MTAAEIMKQLEPLGSDSYKRVLFNHGVKEPALGVKIEELKRIQKRVKKDHHLALALYDTGVYDAQYLAGLIADEARMNKKDIRGWLAKANCAALCGSAVAWVAAESRFGRELALEWIESKNENTAQTGWATLTSLVAIQDDSELDLAELKRLLRRVERTIHQQPNRVRYAMNGFVISLGIYVRELTQLAIEAGEKIGKVSVDMGETACKVPYAPEYIQKAQKRGAVGKKRKTAKC
jgi:3-methyladenine DNA glycosylase AlkD